jgi:LacI family transcriptional regulator
MLSAPPVTQRDVALACGVHPSTICLALRNSPSIPEETRRRIRQAAEKLGYQPNAAARNLAFLRSERKGAGSLPIAWLNQEARREHWRADPSARVYFDAARRRAGELGYHLEEIWMREPGMNLARIIQIIRARGIESVIFPVHQAFDFSVLTPAWGEFATVGLNDHRLGEWVDLVCGDFYQNLAALLGQLGREGQARVGLVLTAPFDAATDGLVHSSMLRHQGGQRRADRVPVCFVEGEPARKAALLQAWLEANSPDAVIACDPTLATPAGGRIRWLSWHDAAARAALGLDDSAAEVGAAAVDCVVEKNRRFARGFGGPTRLHLIKGLWREPVAAKAELESVVA